MKTTIPVIIILFILIGCQKRSEDKTLVFPTGRYANWTNFELIHMAFKLKDEVLVIDNDYDFDSKTFTQRGFEKATEYPATTEFLRKTLDEYRTLSKNINTSRCDKLTPIYVEYKNGKTTDLISFITVTECTGGDSLSRIENELGTLRQKYVR